MKAVSTSNVNGQKAHRSIFRNFMANIIIPENTCFSLYFRKKCLQIYFVLYIITMAKGLSKTSKDKAKIKCIWLRETNRRTTLVNITDFKTLQITRIYLFTYIDSWPNFWSNELTLIYLTNTRAILVKNQWIKSLKVFGQLNMSQTWRCLLTLNADSSVHPKQGYYRVNMSLIA